MRRLKLWMNSLRTKLFFGIVATIVPLIIVLLINNYYSVQVVRKQVSLSNSNMLSLYMGQIDRNLQEVDNYLINMLQTNLDLLEFDTSAVLNENNYTKAKLRLFQTINDSVGYYKSVDLFFLYSEKNRELVMTQSFGNGYTEREQVAREIERMLKASPQTSDIQKWYTWKSNEGNHYLYHVLKSGQVYIGAWVDATKLIVPLQLIDLGKSGAALLADDRLEPMSHEDLTRRKGIKLSITDLPYTLSGVHSDYMVMGEPSIKGSFYLFALIPEETVLEKLPYLQRISSIVSIGAVAFLLLFILIMRRVFLMPINRIIRAMRKLGDGNWDSKIEQYPASTEFEMMNATYNGMIAEIHDLKINVYEEKLNHQRAELRQLQLQINPHFFLNSLNIIYNLATVKDFRLIQEMSKCLVVYFRFMFRSHSYVVTLEDELTHTRNYLRIQQLRFPGVLTFQVEAPAESYPLEVPPLIIQTMVENTIKHAVNMDNPIHIGVSVRLERTETGSWIIIDMEDTGPGFPAAVLEKLQEGSNLSGEDGEHIGIWNVRRRIQLLYADKAAVEFYNAEGKGAAVRIRIPAETKDRSDLDVPSDDRR